LDGDFGLDLGIDMEQKRVLIEDPDTNWIIKGLGDDSDPFSSTDIGMIYENEPTQDCGGDYCNDPPKYHRKAKSSHKQNARKQSKRNRK